MSEHEFKPGDIVRWNANTSGFGSSRETYGALSRVAETSATIKPEGGGRAIVIKRKSCLHRWRFYHVPKAAYALVLWARRRPKCEVIAPRTGGNGLDVSATIGRDPARIDAAIVELTALRQWLVEEPQP